MLGVGESNVSPTHSYAKSKEEEEEEEQGREMIVSKYKEKVSTLPKGKPWAAGYTYMYKYQSFWYTSTYGCSIEGVLAAQDGFKARADDVILATNPKCGTTWLKALAFAVLGWARYGPGPNPTHPLVVGNPHDCVPYIEIDLVFRRAHTARGVEVTDPQLLATHMPYVSLPRSVLDAGCRMVYICREAKDAFVSRWFFFKKIADEGQRGPMVTFEEAFELFCKGVTPLGPYWDHVLGYYKASLERPDKVLFLKYEEMKKDPVSQVRRLAGFLGRAFTADEEAQGVVEAIVELCSFDKMKNLEVNKSGLHRKIFGNELYFREGKVGDSANHLTPKMIETIDRITKEKFDGYDLSF